MAFNPQETISIFDGEDVDIIGKCLEIGLNKKLNSQQVLMRLDYLKFYMSFPKLLKAVGGNTSNLDIERFNEMCDFYGISKEYGKYVLECEFNFMLIFIEYQQIIILKDLHTQPKRLKNLQDINT